ncbi:hypothetical protein [Ilumatobacter sp.]|uniref:hypothetical protein n=1 Tax=Ilumatobacter sp. TaxID=1967498 RepID=UPI003B529885
MSASKIRRTAALLVGAATIGVLPTVTSTPTVSAQAADLGAGGEYFPITPIRVFDTNLNGGRVPVNSSFEVDVLGEGGVPDDDVLAVAANITLVDAPGRGYVSVRPSDYDASGDLPTSLINFETDGQTVPNFGIIGVGSEGRLTIDVRSEASGDVRVAVDIFGWVAKSAFDGDGDVAEEDGARLVTVTPQRLVDTRESGDRLGTRDSLEVPARGRGPVPDSPDVSAVVINLTGINNRPGSTTTYLSASADPVADGQREANSSNGNYPAGVVKANLAIVPVNDAGSFFVFNRAGATDVAIDVVGYMRSGGAGDDRTGRIVPLESPFRSFDTRSEEFGSRRLGYSSWESWSFQEFAESVSLNGVEVGAQAGLVGNLTAAGLQPNPGFSDANSYMTLNPSRPEGFSDAPGNSNLNFEVGGAVANSAVVTYGTDGEGDDEMVSAYNADGSVHYILDVYAVVLD